MRTRAQQLVSQQAGAQPSPRAAQPPSRAKGVPRTRKQAAGAAQGSDSETNFSRRDLATPSLPGQEYALVHIWSKPSVTTLGGKSVITQPNIKVVIPKKDIESFLNTFKKKLRKKINNVEGSTEPSRKRKLQETDGSQSTNKRAREDTESTSVECDTANAETREEPDRNSTTVPSTNIPPRRQRIYPFGSMVYDADGNLMLGTNLDNPLVIEDFDDDEPTPPLRPEDMSLQTKLRLHKEQMDAQKAKKAASASAAQTNDTTSIASPPDIVMTNINPTTSGGLQLLAGQSLDTAPQAQAHSSPALQPPSPSTSRGWGLGKLTGSISGLFGRRHLYPISEVSPNTDTVADTNTTPAQTNAFNTFVTAAPTEVAFTSGIQTGLSEGTPQSQQHLSKKSSHVNTSRRKTTSKRRKGRANPVEQIHEKSRAGEVDKVIRKSQTVGEPEIVAQAQDVAGPRPETDRSRFELSIVNEHTRKLCTALQKEHDAQQAALEAANPGSKRKRFSPPVIPNPVGCSYGMDLDFFMYDSDSEDDEPAVESPSLRPAKRVRIVAPPATPTGLRHSSVLSRGSQRASSSNPVIGDPHRARPYTGRVFADPVPNEFVKPTPSRTFTVPDGSDSGSDVGSPTEAADTTLSSIDNGKGKKFESSTLVSSTASTPSVATTASKPTESWQQAPPPRPNPPHAALPSSSNASVDNEALARARSQALRYTPSKPSGLRAISRLSNSTVASSDAGEDEQGISATTTEPMSATATESILRPVFGELSGNEQATAEATRPSDDDFAMDVDVEELVGSIAVEDLIQIGFAMDPEVQALVENIPAGNLIKFDFPQATVASSGNSIIERILGANFVVEQAPIADFGPLDADDADHTDHTFNNDFAAWRAGCVA